MFPSGLFLVYLILTGLDALQSRRPSRLPRTPDNVCTSTACVEMANELRRSMDTTVNPCNDFYQFTCGNYARGREEGMNAFNELRGEIRDKLNALLKAPHRPQDPPMYKKAKDYYLSCMDTDRIEQAGLEPLQNLLDNLGGWPVVDSSWDATSSESWQSIIIRLHQKGLGYNYIFKTEVGYSVQTSKYRPVLLSFPDMTLSTDTLETTYETEEFTEKLDSVVEIAQILGAKPLPRVMAEIRNVFEFERTLYHASHYSTNPDEYDITTGAGIKVVVEPEFTEKNRFSAKFFKLYKKAKMAWRISIKKLRKVVKFVQWEALFKSTLQIDSLENVHIYTSNPNYLVRVMQIFYGIRKRTVINYLLMRAILDTEKFVAINREAYMEEMDEIDNLGYRDSYRFKRGAKKPYNPVPAPRYGVPQKQQTRVPAHISNARYSSQTIASPAAYKVPETRYASKPGYIQTPQHAYTSRQPASRYGATSGYAKTFSSGYSHLAGYLSTPDYPMNPMLGNVYGTGYSGYESAARPIPGTGYRPTSGYGSTAGYRPTSGYGPTAGYRPTSGYGPNAGYRPSSGYGPTAGYRPTSGDGPTAGYRPTSGYGSSVGYVPNAGSTPLPGYRPKPGYRPTVSTQIPGYRFSGYSTLARSTQGPGLPLASRYESTSGYRPNTGSTYLPTYGSSAGYRPTAGSKQVPGYRTTSGYTSLPGSAQLPGYGTTSGYASLPGSTQLPGYGTTSQYASLPGATQLPGYGTTSGYASLPGSTQLPGYGTALGYASLTGTSQLPGYGTTSGYTSLSGSTQFPGYGTSSGYASLPGTTQLPGYGTSSGYALLPGSTQLPGYGTGSGYALLPVSTQLPGYGTTLGYDSLSGPTLMPTYGPRTGYPSTYGERYGSGLGYGAVLGYPSELGYPPTIGYSTAPKYTQMSDYGSTLGYTPMLGYAPTSGYTSSLAYPLGDGYSSIPGYAQTSGYRPMTDYTTVPRYGSMTGYPPIPGYTSFQGYGATNYAAGLGYVPGSSNASWFGYGPTSGYATTFGYSGAPQYAQNPGFAPAPIYSGSSVPGYAPTPDRNSIQEMPRPPPATTRELNCTLNVMAGLPLIAGNMFINSTFFQSIVKTMSDELMNVIRSTFRSRITRATWMDDNTKTRAIEKLEDVLATAVYPPELVNVPLLEALHQTVTISRTDFFANVRSTHRFMQELFNAPTTLPPKQTIWLTKAERLLNVGAWYFGIPNSIYIPLGILGGMFFNPNRPQSLNYGGVAVVVGHEYTRGFDVDGSQMNKDGQLENWWSANTSARFQERTQCLINQFNAIDVPELGRRLNGTQTVDEDIADNGGFRQAHEAYLEWMRTNEPEPTLPGIPYNQLQLYWISLATTWCSTTTPQILSDQIRDDDHSPDRYRINVAFRNFQEFATDFGCPVGSPMNPPGPKCLAW